MKKGGEHECAAEAFPFGRDAGGGSCDSRLGTNGGARQIPGTQANRQEGDRHGACQEGPGRQISGTQTNGQDGDRQGDGQKAHCSGGSRNAGRPSHAEASSRRAAPIGSAGSACRAEARDAGRPCRAEPVHAAAEFRRSGAHGTAEARRAAAASGSPTYGAEGPAAEFRRSGSGPNGTAEARRAAARGSPGFACGAKAHAGPAFRSQQHPVDAGSWGWVVGHQWLVTRCVLSGL
jgi:hypothetical protein